MTTEVLRHRNSLAIRWVGADGDRLWTVVKKFNLGTRILEPTTVELSGRTRWGKASDARQVERELHYAVGLANSMDTVFIRPEHFDLVTIADDPAMGGYPALVGSIDERDGRVYIAIDKGNS